MSLQRHVYFTKPNQHVEAYDVYGNFCTWEDPVHIEGYTRIVNECDTDPQSHITVKHTFFINGEEMRDVRIVEHANYEAEQRERDEEDRLFRQWMEERWND